MKYVFSSIELFLYLSFHRIEIRTTIASIRNLSSKCIYHPKNTNIYITSTIAPAESQIPVRKSSFIVHRDSALEFGREESSQRRESGWKGEGWIADLIRRKSFPVRVFEIVGEESCKTDTAAGM